MFARNTPTRMKGSAVVQGLKSLASKLHPQLPLSAKESQRLLTALTTSFRKQLDQAHPPRSGGQDGARPEVSLSKAGTKQLHSSSATFADKHLASVLTNPLLSKADALPKPVLDLESAKIDLDGEYAKNPVALLEKYHERGVAAVPIAALCLESFDRTLESLPEGQREAAIKATNAGKRTLLWLWNSKIYENDEFVENTHFMKLLCSFLIREQSEEYFWDWWKLDLRLGTPDKPDAANYPPVRNSLYRYRWKGRMLRALMHSKLREATYISANSAIDAFLRARDTKESAIQHGAEKIQYPLLQAWMELGSIFAKYRSCAKNTDPARYDRLLQKSGLLYDGYGGRDFSHFKDSYKSLDLARMWLLHPQTPSATPALGVFRDLYESESPKDGGLLSYIESPRNMAIKKHFYFVMVRTAVVLENEAQKDDFEWIICLIRKKYPDIAASLEHDLEQERRHYGFPSPRKVMTANKGIPDDAHQSQSYPGVFHLKLDRV